MTITRDRIEQILNWANPKRGRPFVPTGDFGNTFDNQDIEKLCDLALRYLDLAPVAEAMAALIGELYDVSCSMKHGEGCDCCLPNADWPANDAQEAYRKLQGGK